MNKEYRDFDDEFDELNKELEGLTLDDEIDSEMVDEVFIDESQIDMDELEDYVHETVEFDPDEIEDYEVQTRTAILAKNDLIALICLKTADKGGAICRVDPRETNPAVQIYDDPANATNWFARSIRSSKKNGWTVIYEGLPLEG
ncbi:MAG: hypothetical protein R2684_01230 [Pyrinomonadaceae bacterium]